MVEMFLFFLFMAGTGGAIAASNSNSSDDDTGKKESEENDNSLINFPYLANKSIYSHKSSWENPITGDYMKRWIDIEEED